MIGQTDTDKRNSGAIGVLAEASSHDAAAEIDRVAAERLIRSTIETLARGASVKDVDGLVQRNLGNVTLADVRAGRLGSNVLGDIVNTVEQAKGNAAFNWNTATQEQIKAYLTGHGLTLPQSMMDGNRRTSQNDGSGRSSGGSDARGTAGITEANFSGSSLEKMGLSVDTFKAMHKEGFNNTQIASAVTVNKLLGIQANDNPAATARLQRDTPWAVDSLKQSHDALKEAEDCDEKAKQAEAKGDNSGAQHWRKQGEEKRKAEAERHRQTQERLGREKPERLPDYNSRHDSMQRGLHGLRTGNEQEDKATLNVIEDYRRHPNDAAVRQRYEALNKQKSADPRTRVAMQKIDKGLHQGQKAEVAEAKKNDAKVAENDRKEQKVADTKREDDVLAAMFSAASSKAASGETPTVQPESHSEPKPVKTASIQEASSKDASSKGDQAKKADTKPEPATTAKAGKPAPSQKTRLAGSLNLTA